MRINNNDIPVYKDKIRSIVRIQPLVYPSGVFELHDVAEADKDKIIRKLAEQDFIENVSFMKSCYDFAHYKFDKGFAEPAKKYIIRGVIAKELSESAEKYKWVYSGNVYQFNNILGHVDLKTSAVSFKQAVNNFKFQAAEQFGINRREGEHVDIDAFNVERKEKISTTDSDNKEKSYPKCPNCGEILTDGRECPLCDLGDSSVLEEGVEVHKILNPKIWDSENKLFPDIRMRLKKLVQVFQDLLRKKGVELHVADAYIIGSNANYNYTDFSDIDLHIIVNEDNDCVKKHLPIIYDAYRSIFDNKYDISIKGISVELYVQSVESTLKNVSSGVYSIKENKWLKQPIKDFAMPEIDDIKFSQAVNEWERKYFNIKINPTIDAIESFIDDIYALREESLANEGEFGFGNLVFKEIRNLGYIQDLKELKDSITEKSLSLD